MMSPHLNVNSNLIHGLILPLICCVIFQFPAASSWASYCKVNEKSETALVSVYQPAKLMRIDGDLDASQDCAQRCCSMGGACNAVSFYTTPERRLCVLLDCTPFRNCTWKKEVGFYAAFVSLHESVDHQSTANVTDAPTTTTMTTTTTTTTTTATTANPTTARATADNVIYLEPEWNMLPNNNYVDDVNDKPLLQLNETTTKQQPAYNYDDDDTSPSYDDYAGKAEPKTETVTSAVLKPEPPVSAIEPEVPVSEEGPGANPDETVFESPDEPGFVESSDPSSFLYSPLVMSAIFGTLGLAVVILVAVMHKLWVTRRVKQYRPLRDYDVRVEPPASSAALLP